MGNSNLKRQLSKLKSKVHFILLAPFLVVLLMQFNNCSKYKQPDMSQSSDSSSSSSSTGTTGLTKTGDLCEDTIRQLFADGYYQFVRQNCATCHATDTDKPQFANPDVNWAYQVFQSKGYQKVSDNAISSTHNPPYTGPQNTQAINELKVAWTLGVQEYNTCKGLPADAPTTTVDPATLLSLETNNQNIPALNVNQNTVLSWNLNSDLSSLKSGTALPTFGSGAKFSITVTRRQNAAGQDYYTFESPIIYANATDVHVKTIYIKLNSRIMNYPSTFKFVDRGIYANSTQTGDTIGLVSTGGLVVLGQTSSADFVNVAFETIEPTSLPPPPPPTTIGFTDSSVRFISSTSPVVRDVDFAVGATGNVSVPIIVSVDQMTDAVCGATGDNAFTVSPTCLPAVYNEMVNRGLNSAAELSFKQARAVTGTSYNRFDWDFKFASNSFNLLGASPSQTATVHFSSDERRENNRVLRLTITVLSNNATVTTQTAYVIIYKADNRDALGAGEVTFSSLMRSTGTLGLNCVKCHNSRDLNGGYDMTNYDLMVTKGVLVPSPVVSVAETSKMFNRMNPNFVGNETLSPMPLDGFLTDPYIQLVRQWIDEGARNN
ncbi:MAG: hypothetical protein ACXWQQ_00225 [Pseudobdellovibrio sp.]